MSETVDFFYNTRQRQHKNDSNFNKRLSAALLNDIQSENEGDIDEIDPFDDGDDDLDADFVPSEDEASDIEDELVIEPNEIFDSDDDDDEEENSEVHANDEYFYGRDGTEWKKNEPTAAGRVRQHMIMRFRSGPKQQNSIPIEVFKNFYTQNISFIIITETNRYAKEATEKWNRENPNSKPRVWIEVTSTELDAFIGLLLVAGVSHNNMQKSSYLWRSDGLPIFRAAMSHKRFIALCRYIRFDNGRTRAFRQQTDKAAPIRDIWNYLNKNLANNYVPYENITVDEQLFPYRGRTKFTQYIPSKPAKYGIKVWWACDSKTKYPLQGRLYTGKDEGAEREVNQGENVLLQFANRFSNSGRTMIADNFFTTLNGTKRLTTIGLSFVGTIRANKRCIPDEMRKNSSRPVLSSHFGFHENLVAICSYVPKKNKAVNLLSTMHYTKHVDGEAMKPAAITFYNSTKAGVDCMDQMVTHFSCKRPTRRWTFAFFCNMLDVMALAAFCICKEIDGLNKCDARRTFLETLTKSLVAANIENRMNKVHTVKHFSSRSAFESYFGRPIKVCILFFFISFIIFSSIFIHYSHFIVIKHCSEMYMYISDSNTRI